MEKKLTLKRKIQFAVILSVVFIHLIGGVLYLSRVLYLKKQENDKRIIEVNPLPMYKDDPRLGFKSLPGKYSVKIQVKERPDSHNYNVTIEEDGTRYTGNADPALPEIWIFGCSFTWGQGLKDEETYPYVLQSGLKNYKVKNFGENGYGNVHTLLQLEEQLKKGKKPKYIIISYMSFHQYRNVAQKEYIGALRFFRHFGNSLLKEAIFRYGIKIRKFLGIPIDSDSVKFHFPQAFLENGELKIRTVPLVAELVPEMEPNMFLVTQKVFERIAEISKENGIIPIIAHMYSDDPYQNDPMLDFLRKKGFVYADAYVKYSLEGNNMEPYDGHPNPKVNKFYADSLLQTVLNLEKNTK